MVGLTLAGTAFLTATCRAREAAAAHPRYVDPFAHLFCGPTMSPAVVERSLDTVIARSRLVDRLLGELGRLEPGGVELVVNLGCGFDMRPYRAAFSHLQFLELDRAEIIDHKEAVVGHHTLEPLAPLTRMVADTASLSQVAADETPAVCLTEGLVTYLDRPSVVDLATSLRARPGLRYWLTDWVGPASTTWLNQQSQLLGGDLTHQEAVPISAIEATGFELIDYHPLAGELQRMGATAALPRPTRASEPGDSVLLFRAR